MRVLAIGATGFMGPHVVRFLLEKGHDVTVLHRGRTRESLPAEVRRILGNRNSPENLRAASLSSRPDVVLDVIPYTERQARGAVEAFRGVVGRLVALSSADVYRNYDGFRRRTTVPPDPAPLPEEAPLRDTLYPYRGSGLPYSWADDYEKILVERVILGEPDLPGTALRLGAVYGPGDAQHRLDPYLDAMDSGQPTVWLEEERAGWRWTRAYVENVAAAVALAVTDDRAAGRVYNVGDEPAPTEREWVQRIGRTIGWIGEISTVPAHPAPQASHEAFDFRYDLVTDARRIRKELGFAEVVGPQQAMDRTVEWERAHRRS